MVNTLTSFTFGTPTGTSNCFIFALYLADGLTLAASPPTSFITFNYPTVSIGVLAVGSMGTTP